MTVAFALDYFESNYFIWFLPLFRHFRSFPSQCNDRSNDDNGDVVIVVPVNDVVDKTDSMLMSHYPHEHSVCIDPDEAEMIDQNCPKTLTGSSSKYIFSLTLYFFPFEIHFLFFKRFSICRHSKNGQIVKHRLVEFNFLLQFIFDNI